MSGPEIAKALGCDPGVIYRELRRHGIPRRSKEEITRLSRAKTAIRDKIDEGILWEMYYKRRLSKNQIAKALGYSASTISRRMKDLNMESRSLSEALRIARRDLRIEIPEEVLRELYVKRALSAEEIGEILGCSPNTVYRRLQEHGIKVRSTAEAAVRYPKSDFSGDLLEKAYLIGFRLGDLYVCKPNKQGTTILITCSSTRKEQIQLIKSLFEKYGRVNISELDSRGNFSVSCLINESFDFLLEKKDDIEDWILADDERFFAFFAGYSDAEANIGVYSGKARFRIDSYDKNIILKSHAKLASLGIKFPRPYIDRKKGSIASRKRGSTYRKDRWLMETKRKSSLLQLFEQLDPYLKHPAKRKRVKEAIENIKWRNETYGNLNR
jgi:DNA-binding Lrp family transcriptional regulator